MKNDVKKLVTAAVIGALYAALTMVLAPISYGGVIEFRVSEALCVLPFFFPPAAVGLTVGCVIANLISPVGILDVIFGSFASLLAGLCTAWIGIRARKMEGKAGWGSCIAACLMPVVFNAPIVGAVIAWSSVPGGFSDPGFLSLFIAKGASVGIGELVVMLVLGLPLMRYIQAKNLVARFMGGNK